jgi:hypothetical protein
MSIVDTIYSYLPAKRKSTPSGWTKFNAVCCQHNGTSLDTRERGGIIKNGDGVSYHCFNCGFKASYVSGRHLTRKMKQLLSWMGANDDAINKIALEALKIESDEKELAAVSLPVFEDKPLPEDSVLLTEQTVNEQTIPAIEYIYSRGLTLDSYTFYVSESLPDRLIVPFKFEDRVVGYTARKLKDGKPKYLSEQTPGYVFNLDSQKWTAPYVIVVEGPFDAIALGGVAILGAEIMDKQALLINRLGKKVVLLPDRDSSGKRTVEQAIELGWAVSFPNWDQNIKDANDALLKYGSMYTTYSVMAGIETTELKIRLRMKKWFSED